MLIVCAEEARVEADLVGGLLGCPSCGAMLRPWGHGVERVLRCALGDRLLRPRRARCRGCERTHVLLPDVALLRRRDEVSVIGRAVEAKVAGVGHRPIAERLGVPKDTRSSLTPARIKLAATKTVRASSDENGRSVSAAPTAIAATPTRNSNGRRRPGPVRALTCPEAYSGQRVGKRALTNACSRFILERDDPRTKWKQPRPAADRHTAYRPRIASCRFRRRTARPASRDHGGRGPALPCRGITRRPSPTTCLARDPRTRRSEC